MINFNNRRRLIPTKQYKIPFRWIILGAMAVIFLAIIMFFRKIFVAQ